MTADLEARKESRSTVAQSTSFVQRQTPRLSVFFSWDLAHYRSTHAQHTGAMAAPSSEIWKRSSRLVGEPVVGAALTPSYHGEFCFFLHHQSKSGHVYHMHDGLCPAQSRVLLSPPLSWPTNGLCRAHRRERPLFLTHFACLSIANDDRRRSSSSLRTHVEVRTWRSPQNSVLVCVFLHTVPQ